MEIDETIKGRRSIRKYRSRNIPNSIIKELLDLAAHAPSSMNGQPWYFIVIRAEKTKEHLVEIKSRYCPLEKQDWKARIYLKPLILSSSALKESLRTNNYSKILDLYYRL
jgi:nitroreductase